IGDGIDRRHDNHRLTARRGIVGMIEIDTIEDTLQGKEVAVIKLGAGMNIEGRHAIRREALAHEAVEFLRHQMERNVASAKSVHDDEVVTFTVAFQKYAAVALDKARLARFAESEIFPGSV